MALAAVAQPAKPGAATTQTTAAEAQYQGAASPLAGAAMHQSEATPKPSPMTEGEFARARQVYFERCAGCHGALRKGATGKPLASDLTNDKGTEYLKTFIAYGSPPGCPTG